MAQNIVREPAVPVVDPGPSIKSPGEFNQAAAEGFRKEISTVPAAPQSAGYAPHGENAMPTNPVSKAELEQFFFAVSAEPSPDSGKVLAALLIYLAAFVLTLFLFVYGYHSFAFVTLIAVWAVLAFWLQKGGR